MNNNNKRYLKDLNNKELRTLYDNNEYLKDIVYSKCDEYAVDSINDITHNMPSLTHYAIAETRHYSTLKINENITLFVDDLKDCQDVFGIFNDDNFKRLLKFDKFLKSDEYLNMDNLPYYEYQEIDEIVDTEIEYFKNLLLDYLVSFYDWDYCLELDALENIAKFENNYYILNNDLKVIYENVAHI